jgi:positive regulator of sigma E activity
MNFFRLPCILALLVPLTFVLTSCDAIATIFKAGAWTGIIGMFLLILLAWLVIGRFRRR